MRRGFITLLAVGVLSAAVAAFPAPVDAACFGWKSEVFWCEDNWFRQSEAQPDEPSATPTSTPTPTQTSTATATATPQATVTKTPSVTATPQATAQPAPTATATPAPTPTPAPTATATAKAAATATPAPVVKAGKILQSFGITRNDKTLTMPVYSSFALNQRNDAVTRAVVVVHGSSSNAGDYFDYVDAAVPSDVLIVAPTFRTSAGSSSELYWSKDWNEGDESSSKRAWHISSFTAMDELLRSMRDTFPNLDRVTITGHSAGGQFTQRYAATSTDSRNRFVVANPSSYMFLSSARPRSTSGCSWYNEYRYGLADLNDVPYVDALGASTLKSRYKASRVTYLLGANDTDAGASDLDTTCGAETQGRHRRERGENFYESLESVYGSSVYDRHTLRIVSGVGHSAREMFGSSAGRAALAE